MLREPTGRAIAESYGKRPRIGRIAQGESTHLRDLPASQASIIATWEVVVAAFLGWLIFREHLAPVQFFGAALVCFGIGWIQRADA